MKGGCKGREGGREGGREQHWTQKGKGENGTLKWRGRGKCDQM